VIERVKTYASFVRIGHSVFALPFALAGALLAVYREKGPYPFFSEKGVRPLFWIIVAMVAARSAAMGFNRLADARMDALNPRTANRELPRGRMTTREGRRVHRRLVGPVRLRRLAAEPDLFRALTGRARHRVLVFAGEALHDVDAVVPRPRDGGGAGRRLAGRRRTRGMGAVAACGGHRHLGGRLRRVVRLPGSGVRSRPRPAVHSGAVRRPHVASRFRG